MSDEKKKNLWEGIKKDAESRLAGIEEQYSASKEELSGIIEIAQIKIDEYK